jgi:hypothetical protein
MDFFKIIGKLLLLPFTLLGAFGKAGSVLTYSGSSSNNHQNSNHCDHEHCHHDDDDDQDD